MNITSILFTTFFITVVSISGGYGIVGGKNAKIGNFPHQVAILFFGVLQCGGGIIDETHILTAAHCSLKKDNTFLTDIKVLSGTANLDKNILANIHYVKMILIHPNYQIKIWGKYDIAILKLETPIFFSTRRQPISFRDRKVPIFSEIIVTGWGLQIGGLKNKYLRSITMQVIGRDTCEMIMGRQLDLNVFCAIADDILHGISFGDSGTLAIYNGEAVGVAFGGAQSLPGNPAIFTVIHSLLPWINDSIMKY